MANTDALAHTLAERLTETLSRPDFEVRIDGHSVVERALRTRHADSALILNSDPMLKLPIPRNIRTRLPFENDARSVQEFVSRLTHQPWPAPDAPPRLRVEKELVHVWFGDSDQQRAALSWRPFVRAELDL